MKEVGDACKKRLDESSAEEALVAQLIQDTNKRIDQANRLLVAITSAANKSLSFSCTSSQLSECENELQASIAKLKSLPRRIKDVKRIEQISFVTETCMNTLARVQQEQSRRMANAQERKRLKNVRVYSSLVEIQGCLDRFELERDEALTPNSHSTQESTCRNKSAAYHRIIDGELKTCRESLGQLIASCRILIKNDADLKECEKKVASLDEEETADKLNEEPQHETKLV